MFYMNGIEMRIWWEPKLEMQCVTRRVVELLLSMRHLASIWFLLEHVSVEQNEVAVAGNDGEAGRAKSAEQ